MKMLWIPIISEIGSGILALLLILDSWVYGLISSSYKIFMALSGARLLSSDAFATIANKMYIVVGVVMLFVLSYAIIKAIIDPDQMTKGELGGPKLIKGILVAVIGLGIAPVLFNMLYQAQGIILENNVLGNIFFRSETNKIELKDTSFVDSDGNTVSVNYNKKEIVPDEILSKSGGSLVATYVWQAFFYPSSGNMDDAANIETAADDYFNNNGVTGAVCGAAGGVAAAVGIGIAAGVSAVFTFGASLLIGAAALGAGAACYNASQAVDDAYADIIDSKLTLEQAYVITAENGEFGIYTNFLDEVTADDNTISYVFIISTIVGGLVLYAFVSFSIDMGVRCAKLAYYQIIAPIPLILQVLPKFKDSYNKYIKGVFSTFLEVFIRISVVYVTVYIICHITDLFSTSGVWKNLGVIEALFARVLLIVGLVIFAKQAPKLIQETFGIQSGSMSLGIGKKLADGGALVAGAAIGGGITAGVRNFTHAWQNRGDAGVVRGIGRGLTSGFFGGISGAARAGYGARDAKKFSDMTKAAGAGAQAVTDRRDEREAYAESHGGHFLDYDRANHRFTGVAVGKVKDKVNKVTRWAGVDDLHALEKKEQSLQKLPKALDGVKDQAKTLLNKHVSANKLSKNYGLITGHDEFKFADYRDEMTGNSFTANDIWSGARGDTFDAHILKALDDMIEAAQAGNGTARSDTNRLFTLAELKRLRGKYESDFVDAIQTSALRSDRTWGNLRDDVRLSIRTDLGNELLAAAAEARAELKSHLGSDYIETANAAANAAAIAYARNHGGPVPVYQNLNVEGFDTLDLVVDGDHAMKKVNDAVGNALSDIAAKKAKIREKQKDSSDGKK